MNTKLIGSKFSSVFIYIYRFNFSLGKSKSNKNIQGNLLISQHEVSLQEIFFFLLKQFVVGLHLKKSCGPCVLVNYERLGTQPQDTNAMLFRIFYRNIGKRCMQTLNTKCQKPSGNMS